jgi:DNA repair photolyase
MVGLNKQKGNMYDFVTHTWNPIKGKCSHNCSYCYMKVFRLKPIRLDEKELKVDLGENNFIFVGSGTDMFAEDVPSEWIIKVLNKCAEYNNKYLFQTKNPKRLYQQFKEYLPYFSIIGTTIETNRFYEDYMGVTPKPYQRAGWMKKFCDTKGFETMVTIEPIMDFDVGELCELIRVCSPSWVNIGADSKGHKLLEPNKEKIISLIEGLKSFTKVKNKSNLKRLLK